MWPIPSSFDYKDELLGCRLAPLPSPNGQKSRAPLVAAEQAERPVSRALPMASGAAAPAVQTVVLRVAIHCHGCKKKVRKVLRSVEGVQNVTVDASQHKVTVVGTVDANTLIQKLYKSGKKGEPWQYCHPPAKKTAEPTPEAPLPAPKPAAAGDAGKAAAAAPAAADKKLEKPVKEPQGESSEEKKKKPEEAAKKPHGESSEENKKKPEQEGGAAEKKPEAESKEKKEKAEAKKDGGDSKKAETKGAAEPAKEAAVAAPAPAANDKDDSAKKSEKPPKDAGKAEPEPAALTTTERSLPLPPETAPKQAAYEYEQEYRHPYYAPHPVVSYHASQPSSSMSYTYNAPQAQPAYSMQQPQPQPSAYYAHQPQPAAYSSYSYSPQQQQPPPAKQWSPSYLYTPYHPHAAEHPAYYQDYNSPPGTHASPMHDSYRIFDDENPNSCSVM